MQVQTPIIRVCGHNCLNMPASQAAPVAEQRILRYSADPNYASHKTNIRLANNSNEISEFCRSTREPVFITKNGVGDMVVLSMELYERQQAQIELYAKLAEAEAEIAEGAEGVNFFEFAKRLRADVHGTI